MSYRPIFHILPLVAGKQGKMVLLKQKENLIKKNIPGLSEENSEFYYLSTSLYNGKFPQKLKEVQVIEIEETIVLSLLLLYEQIIFLVRNFSKADFSFLCDAKSHFIGFNTLPQQTDWAVSQGQKEIPCLHISGPEVTLHKLLQVLHVDLLVVTWKIDGISKSYKPTLSKHEKSPECEDPDIFSDKRFETTSQPNVSRHSATVL